MLTLKTMCVEAFQIVLAMLLAAPILYIIMVFAAKASEGWSDKKIVRALVFEGVVFLIFISLFFLSAFSKVYK